MSDLKIILFVIVGIVAYKLIERYLFGSKTQPPVVEVATSEEENAVEKEPELSALERLWKYLQTLSLPAWVRVLSPFWVLFLLFYLMSDWTTYTVGEINPIGLVFNNTLNQLWIASARFVFIIGFVFSLVLFSSAFPQWSNLANVLVAIKEKYRTLDTWQKLKLFYFCFFGLMYLFIQLLQVKLPEELKSVLP